MRKVLLVLFAAFILSGCAVTRIDNYDYDKLIDNILSFDIKMLNEVGSGYKYYTPKGVVRTGSNSYNDVLKRGDTNYYLFVDVVSYYYNKKADYKISKSSFYSHTINTKKSNGYVEVKKQKNKLYVKMSYNYAKIEAYTNEKNLKQTLSDMSYVLSSIKFNDSLLKKMYESGNLSSKEEVYKLFDNKEKEGNFLEYIKEYDKYDGDYKDDEVKEEEIKIQDTTSSGSKESEKTTTSSNE